MFKNISIPTSYSLIKKGKVFLLLKEEYKESLLQQGIEDLTTFLKGHRQNTRYLIGRTPHPSIPIDDGKRMVIRQYSHGGIFRAITRNIYLFGSRSFRELILTEEIRSCGIPTIQPIGAIYRPILPFLYQPYFLSLEVPRAKDLIQYFQEVGPHPVGEPLFIKRKIIRSAGILLRRFHEAGFFHGDLQLKNILVAGDQLLLIDFDRSYRKKVLFMRERIKNLLRLNRSVEKWRRLRLPITRTDRWRFFSAYVGDDVKIREAMKKKLQTYSIRYLFYRCSWAIERVLGAQGSSERKTLKPMNP
jgi:3-deoxy-D-manno-octulosonic acid kinase